MTDLLHALARFDTFHVLVVGDFMLDEQVYGNAERLSPDAPVPVLQVERTEQTPGGASNVATCLAGLGGTVQCVGVRGDDGAGRALISELEDLGIGTDGIVVDAQRPTTCKRSLIGLAQHRHPQKMFRLDQESTAPLSPAIRDSLADAVRAAMANVDVVCVEDYGKGVCDEALLSTIMEAADEAGLEVLVDPASLTDYGRYRGCTAITPNRTEAERATATLPADACTQTRGRHLQDVTGAHAIVMTLDRHGALLLEQGEEPCPVPTVPREVYDVTGAGDMVLAALAAGRAHKLPWPQAVQLANAAAGLEVEVFGAQAVPLARVKQEVLRTVHRPAGKVRDLAELLVELEGYRAGGQRIVLTNGCFDVIHAGHVAYLRDAAAQGDLLVVGVNVDVQVKAMKGDGRPVYILAERLEILAELQCVDLLIAFEEPTAHALIEAIKPDLYVKGGDYAPETIAEHDLAQSLGIPIKVLAHRPGLSSTGTIDRLGDA